MTEALLYHIAFLERPRLLSPVFLFRSMSNPAAPRCGRREIGSREPVSFEHLFFGMKCMNYLSSLVVVVYVSFKFGWIMGSVGIN